MSRLLVALLLSLALLRPVGQLALAVARLGLAQLEARAIAEGIRTPAETRVFVFSRAAWQRRSRGRREFWHAGRLYDYQRVENKGRDSVRVTAWPDDGEREILRGLQAFFQPDDSGKPQPLQAASGGLARLLAQPFLVAEAPLFPAPPNLEIAPRVRPTTLAHWPDKVFADPFSPPPEGIAARA